MNDEVQLSVDTDEEGEDGQNTLQNAAANSLTQTLGASKLMNQTGNLTALGATMNTTAIFNNQEENKEKDGPKKSESESFKCIQALLNLFMNKQAFQQIKIDRDASSGARNRADPNKAPSNSRNIRTIILYLQKL